MSEAGVTPDVAIPQMDVAMPEAEIPQTPAVGVDPALAQPEVDPEFPFVLPTGEKYRTAEELANAKVHATETIRWQNQMLEHYKQMVSSQQAPQPVQPQVQQEAEVAARAEEIRRQAIADGFVDNPEHAMFLAKREIESERRAESKIQNYLQKQTAMAEYQDYVAKYPELDVVKNPLSAQVYQQHQPKSVVEHLALVRFYQSQNGGAPPAPAVPPPAFVQPAGIRQQQFSRPAGSAVPQQRAASDPPELTTMIQQALNYQSLTADSERGKVLANRIRDGFRHNLQARTGGNY